MGLSKGIVGLLGLPPLLIAISMVGGAGGTFGWLWIAGQLVAYLLVGLLVDAKKIVIAASLVVSVNWVLLIWIFYRTASIS
ncbi:hypothetical protein [Tsuneonella sp. HG222]